MVAAFNLLVNGNSVDEDILFYSILKKIRKSSHDKSATERCPNTEQQMHFSSREFFKMKQSHSSPLVLCSEQAKQNSADTTCSGCIISKPNVTLRYFSSREFTLKALTPEFKWLMAVARRLFQP